MLNATRDDKAVLARLADLEGKLQRTCDRVTELESALARLTLRFNVFESLCGEHEEKLNARGQA